MWPRGGYPMEALEVSMDSEAKITPILIITCVLVATAGLMFGYDVGNSGGVTSMDDFLEKFFPSVFRRKLMYDNDNGSAYCLFNSQTLQVFTSSLYLAGIIATFFASYTTRHLGRKLTMVVAGFFFISGVVLGAAAQNLGMLFTGRIFLGCGVGFANQAVPLFLSEVAPTKIRGGLNILFQLNVTVGILFANLVNYGAAKIHPWGWRLSLGSAGIPAFLLTIGALLVDDTPTSLVERGRIEEGKAVLKKLCGTDNIESELKEIMEATRVAQQVKRPFRELLQRHNRPPLVFAIFLQIFQQLTGINAILFYSPVLFISLGLGNDASLYSAVILGSVNVLSTLVSIYSVDRVGRRLLLLEAGVQMFISLVMITVVLHWHVIDNSGDLSHGTALFVVVMICTYIASFAWSWGPLGWLIPSETFQLETRSAGQSVTVCVNLLFTFSIAQASLSMLCHLQYGIFAFFSGWVVVMTVFVYFFLPETENVPIEEISEKVWKKHWFWKQFIDDDRIPKTSVTSA
ncbi:Sugar transport protein 13 [Rhynchospora pubera]|uniref:Sugar transport protein 13 n=1 Tax=Rhynchospora pubera TaxID=906938 RepID=A0AAV8ESA5_9POAL|nr:Sugar transport protein 13 [Rhynchospora pubera]